MLMRMHPLEVLCFAPLFAALAVALFGVGVKERERLWVQAAFYAVSVVMAMIAGVLKVEGLPGLLGLFAAASVAFKPGRWRMLALPVFVLLGGMAMDHRLPGFENPVMLEQVRLTADAIPYSLYMNFDKASLALALLFGMRVRPPNRHEWERGFAKAWKVFPVAIVSLLGLSLYTGYVDWSPKVGVYLVFWIPANLLVTCVAEEGIFRQMMLGWVPEGRQRVFALAVSSLCFGLLHYQGGIMYIFLATVAGVFYGLAFLKSKHLVFSVLTHFGVNLVHLLLFTYPALATAV